MMRSDGGDGERSCWSMTVCGFLSNETRRLSRPICAASSWIDWWVRRLRRKQKKPANASKRANATQPTTIPAMAPPLKPRFASLDLFDPSLMIEHIESYMFSRLFS